jgi:uncharacterized membrane protein
MKNVLIAGESWMSYTTHVKGFDSFYTSTYQTGEKWLKKALEDGGYDVEFMPNHIAAEHFPYTMDDISKYDCIILSDIGSNTLLLPLETFSKSIIKPNRCDLIANYVRNGGSLLMVGGYLTFSGIDGKGRWHETRVQDVLPVTVMSCDDRVEHPEGCKPLIEAEHAVLNNISGVWPKLLGYNKTIPKDEAITPVTIDGDPLISLIHYGKGKSAVFTSDCSPHWAPQDFCEWEHYSTLWQNLIGWLTN